jgi:hypothetical protein
MDLSMDIRLKIIYVLGIGMLVGVERFLVRDANKNEKYNFNR